MVTTTIDQNVKDHVSDIMDDILDTETKLCHIKLGSTRNFVAEKSVICMCQVRKQIKI